MSRARSRSLLAVLWLAGAFASLPARAQSESESIHDAFARGKTEYDLANYAAAVKIFEEVYRRKPVAALLFNIAQCIDSWEISTRPRAAIARFCATPRPTARTSPRRRRSSRRSRNRSRRARNCSWRSRKGLAAGSGSGALTPPPGNLPLPSSTAKADASKSNSTDLAPPKSVAMQTNAPTSTQLAVAVSSSSAPATSISTAPNLAVISSPPPKAIKSNHLATWIVGGVGVVALGTGGYFGLQSKSLV